MSSIRWLDTEENTYRFQLLLAIQRLCQDLLEHIPYAQRGNIECLINCRLIDGAVHDYALQMDPEKSGQFGRNR